MHETLSFCKKKKKNGACVFWAPVFFLSFLAGKLRHSKQMLLTEFQWIKKKKKRACVFWAPVFFLSFLARKLNVFKQLLPKKTTNFRKSFFGPLVQTWPLMRLLSSGVFSSRRPFNNLQERGTTEVINKSTISNFYSLNHSKANQLANFIIIRVRSSLARSRPLMLCIVFHNIFVRFFSSPLM